MSQTIVTDVETLQDIVDRSVNNCIQNKIPYLLRKANQKEWLNVEELSELTGWSKRTIYYLKNEGKIPYMQEDRRILFPTDEIEEYLRSNTFTPYKNRDEVSDAEK